MWGNLGRTERNKPWHARASRHPQACGRRSPCRFDPVERQRVPLAGHPVSTGAACPRELLDVSWVGGASRKAISSVRALALPIRRRGCPDPPWREAREQAYVPAEQPPPSQGARFPPAHAHPRGSRDPVLAPPQGPQEPGRLTAGLAGRPHRAARGPSADATRESFRRGPSRGRRAGSRTLVVHLVTAGRRASGTAPPRSGGVRGQQGGGQRRRPQPREAPTPTPGPGARLVAPGLCCARGPGAARRPPSATYAGTRRATSTRSPRGGCWLA